MQLEFENFLKSVLEYSPLVIFGERGVGKSALLLALARFLVEYLNYRVFMIVREELSSVPKGIKLICAYEDVSLDEYSNLLRETLLEVLDEINKNGVTKPNVAILIDDIVPRDALIKHTGSMEMEKKISKFLLLGKIFSEVLGCVFIVTTIENVYQGRPFWFKYYLKFGFNFLRIERISRVRKICLAKFEDGKYTNKECINLLLAGRSFTSLKRNPQ
ncbi:MAG: hypothetical protein NDP13_00935 [Crenarchaeota archaeon]|nr:hypothetical protein [Thermoproteota archaeon]MCR8454813.1 hypothetical protein [Thermoproteota archaeon]MCR8472662.1 hypothetical protein [Thermoproteota archaeon]MCR8486806.1 hypothetical protein [Thermoproteota archaeon]MCR8501888.1 hypothetical protein [Thermoproteota archaeon]